MPHYLLRLILILSLPFALFAEERKPWTSSNVHGSPEPPPSYIAEAVWPHITFDQPLDATLLESEETLFITERMGKIWGLPADLRENPSQAELVIDMSQHIPRLLRLLGLAFHPQFADNGKWYLYCVVESDVDNFAVALSEFRMSKTFQLIAGSERKLFHKHGSGHTGGDIQFGPDGYLYIPIGDLTPPSPPDPNRSGQDLSQFASKILRVDVDNYGPNETWGIPKDNPFIEMDGAHPEIYAYGFRNPWKLAFHPETGDLWVGDVGWEMWEMVYRVEKGGNYGWSYTEGPMPTNIDQDTGPISISPPTHTYDHSVGASITGGYFFQSDRLPELKGAYLYGDYVTGKVWALNWDGEQVTSNQEIADTRQDIVSFGQDISGDVFFLELADEVSIQRLVPNPKQTTDKPFPKRLSATGIFQNVLQQKPSNGVYGFEIQTPMWQDGFTSNYWVAMPGTSGINTSTDDRRGFPVINYQKPKDMVLAKTIQNNGHRIETQILHYDGYWKGYSYQWNETQTDATLVPNEGLDTTVEGKAYRFPSRDECIRCHGSNFNRPLAFFPGQMNRDGQLKRFKELGIIDQVFVDVAQAQPLADPYDDSKDLEARARSWLHSNCSHCHKVSGGSGLTNQMNIAVHTKEMELVDAPPMRGDFGILEGTLIEPGNPYKSILYYRSATRAAGHMPMIGSRTIDKAGVQLVHDWIRSLKPEIVATEASQKPENVEEALALYHRIQSGELNAQETEEAIAQCMQSSDPFVVNLFAGFTID